jgi:uncharacterized protein DUF4337
MSGAHEKLEHAEHAAHHGGHDSGSNKLFGVTMALIGVLIAICSALVGSERNELTRRMIEQTQAHSDWTAASTKFRLVMIELEKQQARVLAARDAPGGWSPKDRFIELSQDYGKERDLAKKWSESYHPIVEAHFDGAEGYEHAQLIAEVGIVMASLGVLLASRSAWLISVLLAVASMIQVTCTYIPTRRVVREASVKVARAEEAYNELRKGHVGAGEDERIVQRLDPDGKIRAGIKERAAEHYAGSPGQEAKPPPEK